MADQYQSNALWPASVYRGKYGNSITTDTHASHAAARGACLGLEREGFGGEGKHFPLMTWVSDIQDPPKLPIDRSQLTEERHHAR